MRQYRKQLVSEGQASPLQLSKPVIKLILKRFSPGIKILDVGCGLGYQMSNIKINLPNYFSRIEGIDWSPATVEYHGERRLNPYDNVTLCKSDRLPYNDQEFDICLSMENLEHLYGQLSIQSLKEMARVAKHVIITTPSPEHVINFNFLHTEIKEAASDPLLLPHKEFICLESAIHKSVLIPTSLGKAGFRRFGSDSHSFFWADSKELRLNLVQCIGIAERNNQDGIVEVNHQADYRYRYIKLLADSIGLDSEISAYKRLDSSRLLNRAFAEFLSIANSFVTKQLLLLKSFLK
jgi:SAM-dependent methyltransferase